MRFSERVVLVTGGARGIGAGCCRVFAKEGAYVAVVDRDASAAETLARSLTGSHTALTGSHTAIVADVALEDQIRAAVDRTIATYGRIDCVINNAGVHPPDTPLEKMAPEKVMDVLRVNFLSTYAMCYYALPHLKKTRGTIVNISSMTAVLGQRNSTAYAASNTATTKSANL